MQNQREETSPKQTAVEPIARGPSSRCLLLQKSQQRLAPHPDRQMSLSIHAKQNPVQVWLNCQRRMQWIVLFGRWCWPVAKGNGYGH